MGFENLVLSDSKGHILKYCPTLATEMSEILNAFQDAGGHVLKRCSRSHLRVKPEHRVLNLRGSFKNLSPPKSGMFSRGKVQINKECPGSGLSPSGTSE